MAKKQDTRRVTVIDDNGDLIPETWQKDRLDQLNKVFLKPNYTYRQRVMFWLKKTFRSSLLQPGERPDGSIFIAFSITWQPENLGEEIHGNNRWANENQEKHDPETKS